MYIFFVGQNNGSGNFNKMNKYEIQLEKYLSHYNSLPLLMKPNQSTELSNLTTLTSASASNTYKAPNVVSVLWKNLDNSEL